LPSLKKKRTVVPASVYTDIVQFIEAFEREPPDMKKFDLPDEIAKDIADVLRIIYTVE